MDKNITESNLEEFKKLIRKAIFLRKEEDVYFNAIPNENWIMIFSKNFGGNFEYARRVLLKKFKEIERIDAKNVDKEKNKIVNLEASTKWVVNAIENETPILFITDFDNDGSLAQAIIQEYLVMDKKAQKNSIVEYSQSVNGNANRGLTVDHVDLIVNKKEINTKKEFLIVTADNGINSREEQLKILKKYPQAKIIITDHHNPDSEMVIEENERTIIFNPHYKPTKFFEKYNISGASTVGVLLKSVLEERLSKEVRNNLSKNYEKLDTLFKVSNLLDYVETHPADKPEKDYIITKFLQLQPLMNINNSISKIITGEISQETIEAIKIKIPKLNVDILMEEAENIHIQNQVAKILLYIYKKNKENEKLTEKDFYSLFLQELKEDYHYEDFESINPNFIEQLRPIIFSLSADYDKNAFLDAVNEKMIDLFENVKISEKKIGEELRRGEVITRKKLKNSYISYADKNILSVFNRKFLNKIYNDENPGFSLTLDNVEKTKVSGSFRSLYNISDILKNKAKIEKKLHIKIETPGHEKAAGFIIKALDIKNYPITDEVIEELNKHINQSIEEIKQKEIKSEKPYILTDFTGIKIIDRINTSIRGNISNFEKITPIIKINENTIWTDSYTTKQYTMKEIIQEKKYGYITINTDFDGGTVIVPVELIRKIVQNNYQDYFSLGYMDGGVFMVDRVVEHKDIKKIIDVREENHKTKIIKEAFTQDFKDKNLIKLNREQIQDNPFFKYHDYGKLNFDLFERMVIGIIDTNNIDILSIFDVEANGFGNSKIMNYGAMNYFINPKSGQTMDKDFFYEHLYYTQRGEEYLLTQDETSDLKELTQAEFDKLNLDFKKQILLKKVKKNNGFGEEESYQYYLHKDVEQHIKSKKKSLPFLQIKNYNMIGNNITFNRSIQATMSAYLIKDKDFKVPQEMTNLTGITQELLNEFGQPVGKVDKELSEYYKDKKVLFGAHNIPYDARVIRANLPKLYKELKNNRLYDSALFAKEQKLAYDDVEVCYFEGVPGLKENIYFYNNLYSDFNLIKFLEINKNGYYPDRTNQYLLEIENDNYYLVDKNKHEKVKITINKDEMMLRMRMSAIPNVAIKYSVEKLSEQWMIHSLLLSDEKFDIQLVDLNQTKYDIIKKHEDALIFFQNNYHFDISAKKNIFNFMNHYHKLNIIIEDGELSEENQQLSEFVKEFLQINKNIQQKFADSWMYKKVLEIKDPNRIEVTSDLVELVHYQTHIPKYKIRKIFEDAIKFKEKYNIENIIQHELHANGPWRTDNKGDIAFEDKLTLSLLAQREYNSYDHNVNNAIEYFNNIKIRAKMAFDIADKLSDDLAQDSYSFRQGILYDRDTLTPMIETIQIKEKNINRDDQKQIVKYKLDNDVLPPDAAIYCILKKDRAITRETIEDHKKKLSFILLNQQIVTSLHNIKKTIDKESIEQILKSNEEKMIQYKEELAQYYEYIEYNKKDYQMKQFIAKAKDYLFDHKEIKNFIALDINLDGIKMIKDVINNLVCECKNTNLKEINEDELEDLQSILKKMEQNYSCTNLEKALAKDLKIIHDENIVDKTFLNGVDILRQKPVERIVKSHLEYRLINNLVKEKQNQTLNKKERGFKL